MNFYRTEEDEHALVEMEAIEEDTSWEEAIGKHLVVQLIDEVTIEEQDDDKPLSVKIVPMGSRIDLAIETNMQFKSS